MSNLNQKEIELKPNSNKLKRKNIKTGILGYPKKNRILYFFNNNVSLNKFNLIKKICLNFQKLI